MPREALREAMPLFIISATALYRSACRRITLRLIASPLYASSMPLSCPDATSCSPLSTLSLKTRSRELGLPDTPLRLFRACRRRAQHAMAMLDFAGRRRLMTGAGLACCAARLHGYATAASIMISRCHDAATPWLTRGARVSHYCAPPHASKARAPACDFSFRLSTHAPPFRLSLGRCGERI